LKKEEEGDVQYSRRKIRDKAVGGKGEKKKKERRQQKKGGKL
jgi:hypothetical protein